MSNISDDKFEINKISETICLVKLDYQTNAYLHFLVALCRICTNFPPLIAFTLFINDYKYSYLHIMPNAMYQTVIAHIDDYSPRTNLGT